MITGRVLDLEAHAPVSFRLASGNDMSVDFVVDTGFAGALTLPAQSVAHLGLELRECIWVNLADGSSVAADVFRATVLWDDSTIDVAVIAMEGRPLLGTAMLEGHELVVRFAGGGLVTIQRL